MNETTPFQPQPNADAIAKEREDLRKLLEKRPLTRGALDVMGQLRDAANHWEKKITEAPKVKDNVPLERRFLESHDRCVEDLSSIHYSLGRFVAVGEMAAAAKAVEWQTVDGSQDHKMFSEADRIIKESLGKLNAAKEATVRKLEGLMKMGYVQDAIHADANAELEIFDKDRGQKGQE